LKKEPTNIEARNIYADLLVSHFDNAREAVEQLKLAAVLDKTTDSRLKLAGLLRKEKHYYDSLAEYQLVLDQEPTNFNALSGFADNYRLLGFKDEAVRDEVRIYRSSGSGKMDVIAVDYDAILDDKISDVKLKDKDVVMISTSYAKKTLYGVIDSIKGFVNIGGVAEV